jgi:PAS domain S-box-containing protein
MPLFSSLRFRILLLILLAVLPALLLTLRAGFEQRRLAAELAQEAAFRTARLVSAQHQSALEGTQGLLIALAESPEVNGNDPAVCQDFLGYIHRQFPNYLSFSVILPDGEIWCDSQAGPGGVLDVHPEILQMAAERQGFAAGDYHLHGDGPAGIPLVYPVVGSDGRIEKYLVTILSLNWFYEVADGVRLPELAALLAIDSQGTILARQPEPHLWVGQTLPEAPAVSAILEKRDEGLAEVLGLDGINRLYAFSPLSSDGDETAYVSIGIPTQVAYAQVNQQLAQNLLLLVGVALFAFVVTWVLGDQFLIQPINALMEATRRLETGQLNARANLKYDYGEISLLSSSFDQMADTLEERERQILQAEAKFRTLVEQVPAIIYTVALDEEIRFLYVSPQVEDIFGFLQGNWLADANLWIQGIHEDERDQVLQQMQQAITEHKPFQAEYRFTARNGTRLWIRDEALLVYDLDGTPLFLQGILLNITERKEAEAALRVYAVQLERSNRELQDFAYIASHDLQEPLRKIQAFGERLDVKFAEQLGDEGTNYVERMRSSAARMQILINDLLSYSRVTTKANPFVPVDLNQVAEDVLSDLGERVKETGGQVELGDLPRIEADQVQMQQLLQNLIANALKFHRPGSPPHIRVSGRIPPGPMRRRRVAELRVEDNGIGFDEKYLQRIFQPFQRLHGRGQYEGSGIGLAICRKIVERHGGTITARSAPGEGTTFIVELPLYQHEEGVTHEN